MCFAGHTDVVPVGDEANWKHEPFAAEIKDGLLYGRGATDMKGSVAAFAAAAIDYLKHSGKPAGSISFLITGDEEGPAINGTMKVLEWMKANGHIPDHCLVGEPTCVAKLGDTIKIGRRGSLSFVVSVAGIQGHVAYPQKTDNPIPKLARLLDRISFAKIDDGNDHFDPSSLAVTTVDVGNPAGNVVPARATAKFNIRYSTEHDYESLRAMGRRPGGKRQGRTRRNLDASPPTKVPKPSSPSPAPLSASCRMRWNRKPGWCPSFRPPAAHRTPASSRTIARCWNSAPPTQPPTRLTSTYRLKNCAPRK